MHHVPALRRASGLSVWLGLALWAPVTPALAAPIPAIQYSGVTGIGEPGATSVAGWAFNLNSAIRLVSLGAVLDDPFVGFPAPSQAEVGLWDPSGLLVASTTVFNSDPLVGQFRYRDISPVELPAANGYTVAALWQPGTSFVASVTVQSTPAEVSYVEARFLQTPVLARPAVSNGGFDGGPTGEFGGTFRFEPGSAGVVPEPGTLALVGCGFVRLLRRRRH